MGKSNGGKTKPMAFVAMCFDDRLSHVYHKVIRPVLEEFGFECVRADEICKSGVIVDQIRREIEKSRVVICDLTFENPNVFYELGMAHYMDKDTIMLSQTPANVPFDVRHFRVLDYRDDKIGLLDFRAKLVGIIAQVVPEPAQPDMPPMKFRDYRIEPDELEVQRTNLYSHSLEVKRYAIKFLGDCRDMKSFNRIEMSFRQDQDDDIKRDALIALHKINPDAARPFLLNEGLLFQTSYLVRETAVYLLARYKPDTTLMQRLLDQSGDTSWGVRRAVCEVLGRWGGIVAKMRLEEMQFDVAPEVRLAAQEALDRLDRAGEQTMASPVTPAGTPPTPEESAKAKSDVDYPEESDKADYEEEKAK